MIGKIKIGMNVGIEVESSNSGIKHKSKIEEMEIENGQTYLYLAFIIKNGKYVKLPKEVTYIMSTLINNNIYKYEIVIDSYVKMNKLPYLKVRLLSEGEKIQRREYYRLGVKKNFDFINIDDEKSDESIEFDYTEEDMKEGYSLDICAGGIKFYTNNEVNNSIKIFYRLETFLLITEARIINIEKLDKSLKYKYEVRAMFQEMPEEGKDKLVSYIFSEERRKLKKK